MLVMTISRYGLQMIDDMVAAIKYLASRQHQRVVGLFGFYRSFTRNFSRIAKPLNDLKRKNKGRPVAQSKDGKIKYTPSTKIDWDDDCQFAFDELKGRLSKAPILAHPLYDRPFIQHTDASKDGFGAVLSQLWKRSDFVDEGDEIMVDARVELDDPDIPFRWSERRDRAARHPRIHQSEIDRI